MKEKKLLPPFEHFGNSNWCWLSNQTLLSFKKARASSNSVKSGICGKFAPSSSLIFSTLPPASITSS